MNPTDSPTEFNEVGARSAGGVGEDNPLVGVFLIFIIMSLFLLCCLGFRSFLRWYNEDREYTMIDFLVALCGAFGDDEAATRAKERRNARRKGVIEAQVEDPETGEMKTLYFYPVHGSSSASSTTAVTARAAGVAGFNLSSGNREFANGTLRINEREGEILPDTNVPSSQQFIQPPRPSSNQSALKATGTASGSMITARAVRSSGLTALSGNGPSQKHHSREHKETSNVQIINLDSNSDSDDSGDFSGSVHPYPRDHEIGSMISQSHSSVTATTAAAAGNGSRSRAESYSADSTASAGGNIGERIRAISFERSGLYGADDEHTIDDYMQKYLGVCVGDDDDSSSSGNDGDMVKSVAEPVARASGARASSEERRREEVLRLDSESDDSDLGIVDLRGLPKASNYDLLERLSSSDSDVDSDDGDDDGDSIDSDIVFTTRRDAKPGAPPAGAGVSTIHDQNEGAGTTVGSRNRSAYDNDEDHNNPPAAANRRIIVLISSSSDDDDDDVDKI
jgi:hypothetical protein